VYIIMAYKGLTVCKHDPVELYDKIKAFVRRFAKTKPSDYFISSDREVLLDAADVARARKIPFKVTERRFTIQYLIDLRLPDEQTHTHSSADLIIA
jgi:hypothetical protein